MPEIQRVLQDLGWRKSGPNFYFPREGRPHFHLVLNNVYRFVLNEGYIAYTDVQYLGFTNRGQSQGGNRLPNLHLIRDGYYTAEFSANHLIIRTFIARAGVRHLDNLHRCVYPVMNAGRHPLPAAAAAVFED